MPRKNPHAAALGKLGGRARMTKMSESDRQQFASTGGKARAKKLTEAQRSRIAKLAVAARERKRRERGQP